MNDAIQKALPADKIKLIRFRRENGYAVTTDDIDGMVEEIVALRTAQPTERVGLLEVSRRNLRQVLKTIVALWPWNETEVRLLIERELAHDEKALAQSNDEEKP